MPPIAVPSPTVDSVPNAGSIIGGIAEDCQVSEDEARRRLEETLKFLVVAAEAERPVSPSKAIDEAWHAFLVHTRAYQQFCTEQFGRFIHHQPTPGGDGTKGGDETAAPYRRARAMAEQQFGPLDRSLWPRLSEGAGCKEGACTGECDAHCHGDCNN